MAEDRPEVVFTETERGLIVENNGKKNEYQYEPHRTLYFRATALQLKRTFSRYNVDDAPEQMKPHITGRAVLKDRDISVIALPDSLATTLELTLHPLPEPSQPWVHDKPLNPLHAIRQQSLVYLNYEEPSVEDDSAGKWWCECRLPLDSFEAIERAMLTGTLQALDIGINVAGILTSDYYAPGWAKISWFLPPRPVKRGWNPEEVLKGYVGLFSVTLASADLASAVAAAEADEVGADKPQPVLEPVAAATSQLVASIEKLRVTVTWVGGLVVAALLLLAYLK